jgi:hypothetical protein
MISQISHLVAAGLVIWLAHRMTAATQQIPQGGERALIALWSRLAALRFGA